MERLEGRVLLATTVTAENLPFFKVGADYNFADATSLTVSAGLVIDAGGGNLSFSAPSINIQDGVRLVNAKEVELAASKTYPDAPLSTWGQVATIVEAIKGAKTNVSLGENVSIEAGSLSITTKAGDDRLTDSIPGGKILDFLGDRLGDFAGLPVSVQIKQPASTVEIGAGTHIVTSGNVAISTEATASAMGRAIFSVLAEAKNFGVAAGFTYVDVSATATVDANVRIDAGGAVTIKTTVASKAAMESRVSLNQGIGQTNPKNIDVAYAGAWTTATSRITVEPGAAVVAADNVDIRATATDEAKVKAKASSYRDGLVGIAGATGFSDSVVEVDVGGSITAGRKDLPAPLSFNPALAVDFAARSITFPVDVGFRTGDEVRYTPGEGAAIPGLIDGKTYVAIVDPSQPARLKLAATAEDALAGRAVDLGTGYPTLTTPKGTLPIVSVSADEDETVWFGFGAWPDGSPLFADGDTVQYRSLPGQFIGQEDATGRLIGALPDGSYRVEVVAPSPGGVGTRIRLLDANGGRMRLNTNPQFVTDSGDILQVALFDADAATVSFTAATSGQETTLENAQRIRYVQALGVVVPGLVDGQEYYAVVDPTTPGVIRLAGSREQAEAADPAIQNAVPSLETTAADPAAGRTIAIDGIEPGTGLVFATDPQFQPGTPVVYHAVSGKPVAGLVDGTTYYAYPLPNPNLDPNFPQYIVGLRTVADSSSPLVDYRLVPSLSGAGTEFGINGIDALAGALSLSLPQVAPAVSADSSPLVGGAAAITSVPAGSPQVWTNATDGTFTISLPDGDSRRLTASIPFSATAAGVAQAINAAGVAGVSVTSATGTGRSGSPWTLVGTGLAGLQFDWTNLPSGSAVWSRVTSDGLQAVSTTATGGAFTLTLDVAGTPQTTTAVPFNASAAELRAALNAVPGMLVGQVTGSGTADDPWLIEPRVQPLRTGDPLVFRDSWGSASPGLIDGQTYYAVVAPLSEQGRDDSVVIRLASTQAQALVPEPTPVPLSTTLAFGIPASNVMAGTNHVLASPVTATGINLAALLDSTNAQGVKSENGSAPGLIELITNGDFLASSVPDLKWRYLKGLDPALSEDVDRRIRDKLGAQQANEWGSASLSGAYSKITNTARVVVRSTASLKTAGSVSLASDVIERVSSTVDSAISRPNGGRLAASVAVDIVSVSTQSHATVESGAQVTGSGGVVIDAQTTYPWPWKWLGVFNRRNADALTVLSELGSLAANALGVIGNSGWQDLLVSHFAGASIKPSAEEKVGDRLEYTVAGSCTWITITNDTVALVEDGASINQADTVSGEPCGVTVRAHADVTQFGWTGNGHRYKGVIGRNGLGGAVGYLEIANTTRALLGGLETGADGKPIRTPAGPLRVMAGTGGVTVDAQTDTLVLQVTSGGSKATNFGFCGMASFLDAASQSQVTEAAIQGPRDAGKGAVIVSAGKVDVDAADTTHLIPVAGALVFSDKAGLGVSTAIARLDRDVAARLGGKDDEEDARIGMLDVQFGAGSSITASADGAVVPVALAADVVSKAKPLGGDESDLFNLAQVFGPEPFEGAGNAPQGVFGLAISGDFAWADVDDDVRATVNTTGTVASSSSGGTLGVASKNLTTIQALAGAAAVVKQTDDKPATSIAGSVALIDADSTVIASVRRATLRAVNPGLAGIQLTVSARNERAIGNAAASGAGASQPNSTSTGALAGSNTVNTISATTTAAIDRVTSHDVSGVASTALTKDTIWAAAGSFLVNFSPKEGKATGKSLGVGESFAFNKFTSSTKSTIVDSSLILPAGSLSLEASDASRLFTFAAGVIVTNAGSSLGGMFSLVALDSTVDASVDGGTIDVVAGAMDVLATSALLLVTAAGDVLASRGQRGFAAVGAAVSVVSGQATSTARIGRGTVRVRKGSLSVRSQTLTPDADPAIDDLLSDVYTPHRSETAVWTFAVGVVWSTSGNTAAFSVCVNELTWNRSATITDSATVTIDSGALEVRAVDEAAAYSGAGAIAVSTADTGPVAGGAAVVRNKLSGETTALIDASNCMITVAGSVAVEAVATGFIGTAAVGGQVAEGAALGTALVLGDIVQRLDARILGNGRLNTGVSAAGPISVNASERSRIGAGAGQVDIATKGAAAGAAVAVNTIDSTVNAIIEQARVTSSLGAISVQADAASEIDAYAVGVAGAFGSEQVGFAGVGSGTGNTLTRQITAAVQSGAVLDGRDVSIEANDASKIATAAGTLAVQYSGKAGISAAVGISASTNTVGDAKDDDRRSFVRALVDGSQVTVHGSMNLSAASKLDIQAITAAGAFDVGGGGGTPVGIAGAGAGSGNTVQMEVTAAVRNSTVIQDVTDGITITSSNQTSIRAIAGGVAVAGSGGASPGGVGVTVGAAACVNTVDLRTWALVEGGTSIVSPGTLTVTATGDGAVEAVTFGVAGALRTGGSTFDLSGAGSASVNSVTMDTQAAIRDAAGTSPVIGSSAQPLSSVSVTASDTSSIVAGAGGLASLFSFGEGSAVGLSIGVSFSINDVSGDVSAAIEDAVVFSSGAVDVSAEFAPGQNATNIQCITVAGAAGVAAGGGALFALAGSGSRNTVSVTTSATIAGGAGVRAGGRVTVEATDTSVIQVNAGGIGLGLQLGGGPVDVAVGAAYGKNEVRDTVRARIEEATVTTDARVAVTATARPRIESIGYGVALSASVTSGSVSAAGSGASAFNTVTNTVEAAILGAEVTARAGDVVVQADDEPTISTKAGAGALAIVLGNGVAIAPGVVTLESSVTDTVTARIGRSDRSTVDPNVTAANGILTVQATSTATVTSLGVAVAASAAVGEVSAALAGAGASSTVTLGSTTTAAIEAGKATGTAVNVLAVDRDAATENTVGTGALAIGVVGGSLGVSLAETKASNTVAARIGGTTADEAPSVTATAGGITVDVRGGHNLATESVATAVAIALGATGAGGHAFTTDNSTYQATVAQGASLRATGTLLVQARGSQDGATPDGVLTARAHGGSAGLVAIGAVIASATDGTLREATIGDTVDLSAVAALDLMAESRPNVKAESVAVDVGGIAVTVNQSSVTTSGRVSARTGTGVTLPSGDVRIIADGQTLLGASQTGVAAGILAAGATQTTGASGLATEAVLGTDTKTAAGRPGGLLVRATSVDADTNIATRSGSGGLFAGFGTTGDLSDTTTTRAVILGGMIDAGAVDVGVSRRNNYGITVDSKPIIAIVGVGVTRATFTASRHDSAGDDRVRVGIGAGTRIVAQDRVNVAANHTICRTAGGSTVDGVGGALVSGEQAVSKVDAEVPASIGIDDGVSITSGTDVQTRPGGISLLPAGSLEIDDCTRLSNLGLLVEGGRIATYLTGGVRPQVRVGNDVTLVSHGQLNVGTTAFVASSASSDGWGHGLFGGIGTYATSDVTVDQRVSIGDRVTLKSDGSLSLTPGDDPTGGAQTSLSLDARAGATTYGVYTLPDADATAKLNHTNALTFGSGGNVSSGGNMYLSARAAEPRVTARGEATGDILGVPQTQGRSTPTASTSSTVTLAGTFIAGRENSLGIEISGDSSGGSTPRIDVTTPDPVFGVPVRSALSYAPAFDPTAYIKTAGYSAEVESALLSGVAAGTVAAVSLDSPAPLLVSGGSVAVTGDTISAAGASITAKVGTISIRNESPAYLIIGSGLAIADVEGGRVDFKSGSGQKTADPQGATISRDESTTPTIAIDLTYDQGVGGSTYGPALFLEGRLENLGGNVTIRNVAGSFGQAGTIAAKQITIDTPNGVFAVDTPNDPWNAAGTPAAQVADSIRWPGGNPAKGRPNANEAVMYAINADAAWSGATSDDALNAAVYGQPTDKNGRSWVFFGGSVPQFEELDTNTEPVNKALSAGARVDKTPVAWRMTNVFKGGAHAWMPYLQVLDTYFPVQIPSAAGGTSVTGQVIVINAKVANINGTIQAGGGTSQTQSVVIDASLETGLADLQRQYRLGAVAQSLHRIPDDQLATQSAGDRLIGASFDLRTGQILLDEATSTGGGSVSITGRLINTAGTDATGALLGKIKVQGGSGSIYVRNGTSLPIVTGNLRTSRGEQQAVVSITDLNTDDVTQQKTTYVYDGEEIAVYRGAAGVDLPAVTAPREHVPGAVTRQNPRPNARWQWQEVANMTRSVTIATFTPGQYWPGVDATGWSFTNPDAPWSTPGGPGSGDVVFPDVPVPFQLTQSLDGTVTAPPDLFLTPDYSKDDWGFATGHTFVYPNSASLTMTMSLRADWPIGIDFSGTTFGDVTVESFGSVVVGGNMVATSATIASSGGAITATTTGFLDTVDLALTAKNGIGSAVSPLAIVAERVSASTTDGDVFLDGRRGEPIPMSLGNVWAPKGTVSILAAGDLLSVNGSVRAAVARLAAGDGSVGTLADPLVVEAGPGGTLRFDASATRDVSVTQTVGDMLIGRVTASGGGAVQIAATGDIFNADTWMIDPVAAARRIQTLIDLGATDPDAYKADVESFQQNVTGRYRLYWSVRDDGGNLDLWRPRAAADLGKPAPTDEEVRDYVARLESDLTDFFGDTFGAGWANLPQFAAFDAAYSYSATQADIDRLRKDRYATAAQLALTLRKEALDDPPAGESVDGAVNIEAGSLRLASAQGSVGKNDPPVVISAVDLASGLLTDVQKQELALAATPGDATLTPDDGLVLNVRRPIILAVKGRVDVAGSTGVAIAQKTGDLRVGHVTSRQGLVSVIADGSIRNAETTVDMWGTAFGFERPEDWQLVGDAGQSLSPQGLVIPGYTDSASGTWFGQQLTTGSFRASFIYEASADADPGDGIAFVLQTAGTSAVGDAGSGLGYRGITGPKVGFLINVFQNNTPGVFFDQRGTWQGGGFQSLPFPLTDRPVYVTLAYDATALSMTATLSDQPQPVSAGARVRTISWSDVDLASLLGPSAFMGFTSGTGKSVTTQQVTKFAFSSSDPETAQHVTFSGQDTWQTTSSDADQGFVLSTPPEGPTYTFPAEPNLAAAAWCPRPVRVSTDFRIAFRYRYDSAQAAGDPGNGMALVLQNGPDGVAALGYPGSGLGYSGIPGKKVGYLINLYPGDPIIENRGVRFDTLGSSAAGYYHPIDLSKYDGSWIDVALTYDATAQTFTESLTHKDGDKVDTLWTSTTPDVDLTELLGGTTALLGVTASSGAAIARQMIQSLDFYSPPAASPDDGPQWQRNGSVQSIVNGVLTIPAVDSTATSSWYGRQVSTAGFEASFTYDTTLTPEVYSSSYGIAFVLQQSPAGYAAIGGPGDGLGYAGMAGPKVGFLLRVDPLSAPGVSQLTAGFDDGSGSGSLDPLWILDGPVTVRLTYDPQAHTLTATLTAQGQSSFIKTWSGVDLEGLLGPEAIMGITSGTSLQPQTQFVRNFVFKDRDGIESFKPVTDAKPTVRLWSTEGDIGASGDEIDVTGVLEAEAPRGEIHTNPPPAPSVSLAKVGGLRPDGTPVTNSPKLVVAKASPDHKVLYSTNGGRTWRPSFQAVEGRNDVLVIQVNSRGFRSRPERIRFILDRTPAPPPRLRVLDRLYVATRTGRLKIDGMEPRASVQYSVNGRPWSSTYAPVEGFNVVRVRQIDLAGNASRPTSAVFVLKTRVARLLVSLRRDIGWSGSGHVTTDGRLVIRRREVGAVVQYSTDGGQTWQRRFRPALGLNRLEVRQIDRLGNVSEPTEFEFTLAPPARGRRGLGPTWRLG